MRLGFLFNACQLCADGVVDRTELRLDAAAARSQFGIGYRRNLFGRGDGRGRKIHTPGV